MYIPLPQSIFVGHEALLFCYLFTFGELGMMTALALSDLGPGTLWNQLTSGRDVLFWLMVGGFIWVIGDALSSATGEEQERWKEAALRECWRYRIAIDFCGSANAGYPISERRKTQAEACWTGF